MSEGEVEKRVKEMPLSKGVRVVAWNEDGLVALEKETGVRSHPNREGVDKKSLLMAEYDEERECYEGGYYLLNRLDGPTSGVLLMALNAEMAKVVKGLFRERQMKKEYYAILKGEVRVKAGVWKDNVIEKRVGGKIRVMRGGRVEMITRYEVLEIKNGMSLVRFEPETGRTHQLRVQSAFRGYPVIGDKTYGDFKYNREVKEKYGMGRMYLHSKSTELKYSIEGEERVFKGLSEVDFGL